MGVGDRRGAHRGCPQSKQCLCHQHAWLCTRVRRLSRGSPRQAAAGNACQPTRSSLWSQWCAVLQFNSRDFVAALQTLRHVVRLRPGYGSPYEYIAAALAYLGQSDEAREALERIPPQWLEQLQRWEQTPPWLRPEDYALRVAGVRLAPGGRRRRDPNQL